MGLLELSGILYTAKYQTTPHWILSVLRLLSRLDHFGVTMILVLRTPAFDRVLNAVKQVVATDHLSESVNMGVVNDVAYELFRQCTERVNIVDVDPEYQSLYQPFYEALNELLLLQNVPVIAVSGLLVDGPDCWTVILVVDQQVMYTVGGCQHGV